MGRSYSRKTCDGRDRPDVIRTLYVFVVLSLERRLLLHVNVTAHPYAACAAQQMVEAMGPEVQAERLIRDGDGPTFDECVGRLGLETVGIAPTWPADSNPVARTGFADNARTVASAV